MKPRLQCKDIDEKVVLKFLNKRPSLSHTWFKGYNNSISPAFPEGCPDKLVLAKMLKLISKGYCEGCCCGCRGDFYITKKGKWKLEESLDINKPEE